MSSTTVKLSVKGMNCKSCVAHVTEALEATPGVERADVDLASESAVVTFSPDVASPAKLVDAVTEAGYAAVEA